MQTKSIRAWRENHMRGRKERERVRAQIPGNMQVKRGSHEGFEYIEVDYSDDLFNTNINLEIGLLKGSPKSDRIGFL